MLVVEMVLLIARWDRFRIPVALTLIDPKCRGQQNILFRQMLKTFVPPAWLKSGLHLAQMQVTQESERVSRSVVLSVLAYLLLVRLYGRDEALTQEWSLFKLKEHFVGEAAQDTVRRTELKWQRKLKQFKEVA